MAEQGNKPRVPSATKKLVLDYQNTCIFMLTAWRRLMLILAFALPAAFYVREATLLQAVINAVGFWFISAALTRLLVLEFRLLRAGWVARKIQKRIPAGHPFRESVIDWIRENNDGNYLNSLLRKLSVVPEPPPADLPHDPADPPEGFRPIPITVPKTRNEDNKRRKQRRREYMPLDPEVFEPETAEASGGGEQR